MGEGGSDREPVPGDQVPGAGKGRNFLASLASRKEEVKRRCRTVLQSRAEGLLRDSQSPSQPTANAHPTLALV